MPDAPESRICTCGHPRHAHKLGGACRRCACKAFTPQGQKEVGGNVIDRNGERVNLTDVVMLRMEVVGINVHGGELDLAAAEYDPAVPELRPRITVPSRITEIQNI